MIVKELLSQSIPSLHLTDTVYQALQLMTDNHVTHLPVVEEEKYAGIIREEDLLERGDDSIKLGALQPFFSDIAVKEEEHFLKAVQLAADNELSIIPVVTDENELTGTLVSSDLLKYVSEFMNLKEPGGLIVLEMENNQYSFAGISKLVETNDAQIMQLNTSPAAEAGMMQVAIRINKPDVSDIIATFQRYEYIVKYSFGEQLYANELRKNYDNLMNYLQI